MVLWPLYAGGALAVSSLFTALVFRRERSLQRAPACVSNALSSSLYAESPGIDVACRLYRMRFVGGGRGVGVLLARAARVPFVVVIVRLTRYVVPGIPGMYPVCTLYVPGIPPVCSTRYAFRSRKPFDPPHGFRHSGIDPVGV